MKTLREFLSNRLTWITILFIVLFVSISRMFTPSQDTEFARSFNTMIAFMALIAAIGTAVRAFGRHKWPNEDLLAALALVLLSIQDAFGGLLQMIWRGSSFETWIVNNRLYAFTILIGSMGWLIVIMTPNLFGKGVSNWQRFFLILAWMVAAFVVIGNSLFSPDLSGIANFLKPIIGPN